jgi:hypothetical protein
MAMSPRFPLITAGGAQKKEVFVAHFVFGMEVPM